LILPTGAASRRNRSLRAPVDPGGRYGAGAALTVEVAAPGEVVVFVDKDISATPSVRFGDWPRLGYSCESRGCQAA
jgi:hypothetical protein